MSFYRAGRIFNTDIDALEEVGVIEVDGMKTLWMDFTVSGAPLTQFLVDFQLRNTGNFFTVAPNAAAFTGPAYPVVKASGDLNTAGTSGVHWMKLDVSGVSAVRIRAAGASSNLEGSFSLG